MSWIIGAVGRCSVELQKKIESLTSNKFVEYRENNLIVFAGGNSQTCLFNVNGFSNEKFITVGIGIKNDENKTRFMQVADWENVSNSSNAQKLDGHFVNVRWNNDEIKIFTDVLGLRDIYFTQTTKDVFVFSTRGDWLSKICDSEINFKEFGSRWLLFNQISDKSIFTKIERVCGGTSVIFSRRQNNFTVNKFTWLPKFESVHVLIEEHSRQLNKLIHFPFSNSHQITLSLSGGMDSRLILSSLLNSANRNWYAHTFGDQNHPDSVVAQKISGDMGIKHEQINLDLPVIDKFLAEVTEYVSLTNVNNAVTGYLQLMNYKKLIGRNEVIVDGGFGEIWRREFFNRLLIKGRKELINRNIEGMIPYLQVHHADIFTEEIQKSFLASCKEQLEDIIEALPKAELIGVENWIDLFAIKTRLSNYYSSAQIHLDGWVFSYMPFIQPIILNNLFCVPLSQRKNGKMFREIIKQNNNSLVKYPLAKGRFTHPFF
ncbi:MAG: hypothetical protein HYZ10_15760 [Ignavibacteriales bacterium]|nr:hypothetical protein [Ignavibacteriales bacterium]